MRTTFKILALLFISIHALAQDTKKPLYRLGLFAKEKDVQYKLYNKLNEEIPLPDRINYETFEGDEQTDIRNAKIGFHEGLAKVKGSLDKNFKGGYGFIDTTGKVIIPFQFLYVDVFSDGLAMVEYDNNRSGLTPDDLAFIDKKGDAIIKFNKKKYSNSLTKGMVLDYYSNFSEGYCSVTFFDKALEEKKGFKYEYTFIMSKKGDLTPIDISSIEPELNSNNEVRYKSGLSNFTFSDGLAVTCSNKNAYVINTAGKIIKHTPIEYQSYYGKFIEGLALSEGGYLINKNGEITKFYYNQFYNSTLKTKPTDYITFESNGKLGIKNKNTNEVIIEPEYDDIKTRLKFPTGESLHYFARFKKNGVWGYVNNDTKQFVPYMGFDQKYYQLDDFYFLCFDRVKTPQEIENERKWDIYMKKLDAKLDAEDARLFLKNDFDRTCLGKGGVCSACGGKGKNSVVVGQTKKSETTSYGDVRNGEVVKVTETTTTARDNTFTSQCNTCAGTGHCSKNPDGKYTAIISKFYSGICIE
jgi:hypothetical protein